MAAATGLLYRATHGKVVTRVQWSEAAADAYPRVYRALVALGALPDEAADAVQDAFERGLRRSQDAPAIERPEAWLFVVALRRWRTHRLRQRLFLPLESARGQTITPPPGENAIVLITELKRLPKREREVITCRYILGLTQRETAEALGIAVGTVAATTAHATQKLRERIDGTAAGFGSEAPTIR